MRKQSGFTLIELMIVVVIIGILAAIAIPQFLKYQLKSKTTEATRNLGGLKVNQDAFVSKWNFFVSASATPTGRTPDPAKASWVLAAPGMGFDLLGFAPSGQVYYVYSSGAWAVPPLGALTCGLPDFAVDSSVVVNGLFASIANGVPLTANGVSDIMLLARGDLDGDGNVHCMMLGNVGGDIVNDPAAGGESVF